MKFPITALLAAVVLLPVVMAFSPANWTWRELESKPGPLPTRREVATFIRSLEARNISLNLPSHMINLYRSYNSRNYTGLSTHERPVLPEADTVRSLVAKSFRHDGSRWIVTFDMSTLAANEQLQFAELRISLPAFAESCSLLEIRHHSQYPCGPTVCQDQLVLGSFPPDSALEDTAGCAVYNVTDILRHWMNRDQTGSVGEDGDLPPTESLVCKRKRSLPDPMAKAKPESKEMALLLVFSRRAERSCSGTSSLLKDAKGSRRVRWPRKRKGGRRKQSSKTGRGRGRVNGRGRGRGKGRGRGRAGRSEAPRPRHARHQGKAGSSTPCRRIKFEIKFGKIGWGAWVIFPKVYNAFRCEGECPIPTGEDVKPTNHAYMQSLLKFHHPSLVPSPCCVPTKMSPMSMLYIEKGEVVLRHHENMVVRECGCR